MWWRKRKSYLHVSYNFLRKDGGTGFGSISMTMNGIISTPADVQTIKQAIMEKDGELENIVVLTWKEFGHAR